MYCPVQFTAAAVMHAISCAILSTYMQYYFWKHGERILTALSVSVYCLGRGQFGLWSPGSEHAPFGPLGSCLCGGVSLVLILGPNNGCVLTMRLTLICWTVHLAPHEPT